MPNLAQPAVLDLAQLRDVCLEDPELMREVTTSLIDDARAQIPVLEEALSQSDGNRCARVAHYVKGACANVGAVAMAVLLRNIELSAGSGDFSACRVSLTSLATELERFSSEAASL